MDSGSILRWYSSAFRAKAASDLAKSLRYALDVEVGAVKLPAQ
jgi:hypothetical protein